MCDIGMQSSPDPFLNLANTVPVRAVQAVRYLTRSLEVAPAATSGLRLSALPVPLLKVKAVSKVPDVARCNLGKERRGLVNSEDIPLVQRLLTHYILIKLNINIRN